jgi:hypothetical protein
MAKPRVFVSFDYDHDYVLKFLVGQAKHEDTPFSIGHLEKFLSPSRHESDSVTARGYGMERAGHGAEGLFRC